MKKVNYHTHTELCKHAGGKEMDYEQLRPHLECLKRLQEEYKEKLRICIGLEIEYADSEKEYYHTLFEEMGVEYLLLGQHFFTTSSKEVMNTYFIEQTGDTNYYIDYAKSLEAGMHTGYFKAVAHPDLFFINDLSVDENCEKACDIIVDAATKTNTILEFNANGLRREKKQYKDGIRFPYPHKMFWEKVRQAGVPVLINSDCHNPKQVWDETMENAYALARSWGLNLIDEMPLYEKD